VYHTRKIGQKNRSTETVGSTGKGHPITALVNSSSVDI